MIRADSIYILFLMILMHIIDDFVLQNKFCYMKQESWWVENYPDDLYQSDYKVALFLHSLENAIMVFIPMIIYGFLINPVCMNDWYVIMITTLLLFAVTYSHYAIDDMKANQYKISLLGDQIAHILIIILNWFILTGVIGFVSSV